MADHAPLIARWLAEGVVRREPVIPQLTVRYPQATLEELRRGLLIANEVLTYGGEVRP